MASLSSPAGLSAGLDLVLAEPVEEDCIAALEVCVSDELAGGGGGGGRVEAVDEVDPEGLFAL